MDKQMEIIRLRNERDIYDSQSGMLFPFPLEEEEGGKKSLEEYYSDIRKTIMYRMLYICQEEFQYGDYTIEEVAKLCIKYELDMLNHNDVCTEEYLTLCKLPFTSDGNDAYMFIDLASELSVNLVDTAYLESLGYYVDAKKDEVAEQEVQ